MLSYLSSDEPEEKRKVQNDQTDDSDNEYHNRSYQKGSHIVRWVSGDI